MARAQVVECNNLGRRTAKSLKICWGFDIFPSDPVAKALIFRAVLPRRTQGESGPHASEGLQDLGRLGLSDVLAMGALIFVRAHTSRAPLV